MRCDSCDVIVEAGNLRCPQCDPNPNGIEKSSQYTAVFTPRANSLLSKWMIFTVAAVICISILINVMADMGVWWSLYLMPCVLYVWLTVMHTVMSKYHLGAKIVIQYLGLSGALLWINVLSGHELWSTGYVIPFMGIVATLLITIFCSSKRSHWREFSSYLLTMIFLGFVPLLFYTLGLSDILWTAISAAVYGLLTVGGMCVLAGKESP